MLNVLGSAFRVAVKKREDFRCGWEMNLSEWNVGFFGRRRNDCESNSVSLSLYIAYNGEKSPSRYWWFSPGKQSTFWRRCVRNKRESFPFFVFVLFLLFGLYWIADIFSFRFFGFFRCLLRSWRHTNRGRWRQESLYTVSSGYMANKMKKLKQQKKGGVGKKQ